MKRDKSVRYPSEGITPSATQLSFRGWRIPPRAPLSLKQVQDIYDRINWSFAADEVNRQQREYGTMGRESPISMCKALVLPYLTYIPSLTELARRLEEYDAYRVICGFQGRPPSRAKLWHFQNAPLLGEKKRNEVDQSRTIWFYEVLYRVLVRAVLVGDRLGLDLPFYCPADTEDQHQAQDILVESMLELVEYPGLKVHLFHGRDHAFPVFVRVAAPEQFASSYVMRAPPWWAGTKTEPDYLSYDDGASRSVRQYTACSAIIESSDGNILLGRRKAGYRPGDYALPGGRWRSGETLKECIEREIREETGLQVINLRPVSISFNRYPEANQECWSVGALVTDFTGSVTLREPDKCEGWSWYALDELPEPLFRPSQIVIDDRRQGRFAKITWEEIEDWIEKTQQEDAEPVPVTQLRLDL